VTDPARNALSQLSGVAISQEPQITTGIGFDPFTG